MKMCVAVLGGIWLAACGAQSEPQTPDAKTHVEAAPTASEPAPAASKSTAQAADEPAVPPEAPASGEPVAPASAPASLRDLCLGMCSRLESKCPKSSVETCRINCSKYDPAPDGCENVARSALSCARDAPDLVCANVAPESCAKAFQRLAACAAGKTPNEESAVSAALPEGFAIYENAAERIRAPMPQGVAPGEGNVIASAKTESGALYSIRKLPRPEGKLSEKVFLKVAMNLLGRCSDKMKMQGMVEKPGRVSINYTTKCPDGSEEQGVFWATDAALFVASARGPAGKLGPIQSFVYGFEIK
jgi:hypothetical protein